MDTSSTQTALVPTVSWLVPTVGESSRKWQKDWNLKKKAFVLTNANISSWLKKANDINVNNKQDEKNADDAEKILWIIL